MDNARQTKADDPLAEALRRDAELARPEFSVDLHAHLVTALHAAAALGSQSAAASQPGRLRGQILSWAIATAAAVALLVGLALGLHTWGQPRGETIVQSTPIESVKPLAESVKPPVDGIDSTTDLVDDTATGIGQWMATTVDDNQWAGLDRDAQTAMATVTAPLPFDLSVALSSPPSTEP